MLPRLDDLEVDLEQGRVRATAEGWLGEIECIDRTLSCLRDKRVDALRLTRITGQVDLEREAHHRRSPIAKPAALPATESHRERSGPQAGEALASRHVRTAAAGTRDGRRGT